MVLFPYHKNFPKEKEKELKKWSNDKWKVTIISPKMVKKDQTRYIWKSWNFDPCWENVYTVPHSLTPNKKLKKKQNVHIDS